MEELYKRFLSVSGISTDTREELKNKMFFALKGENFDGNQFVDQALEKGAAWVIADDENLVANDRVMIVQNSLQALQDLAAYHRRELGLPVLAITGSNGKTTTKELVASVLAQKYKVNFTQGNLNNHIGVPLTILGFNKETEFGVVEMGANHQKEIQFLCGIAQPDYGYITNFGKAHLEGFGGFEGVIKGKSELYDYLKAHEGTIFYNADDSLQVRQSAGGKLFGFAFEEEADCQLELKEQMPMVRLGYQGLEINSHLLGSYNAKNIGAAVCVGQYFGISAEKIKNGVENYVPHNNRSQIMERDGNKLIMDAYNANPTSMELAIKNLIQYEAKKRVVFLGDMFEVGPTAAEEHQNIIDLLEKSNIDEAYVCGESFGSCKTDRVHAYPSFTALETACKDKVFEGATILVKGSRGMRMERVLEFL